MIWYPDKLDIISPCYFFQKLDTAVYYLVGGSNRHNHMNGWADVTGVTADVYISYLLSNILM